MKIYETKVEAGTKQWLKIPVDEECSLKAAAFCGSRPGKRLIVTAGVHGCEYIGILAVSRLIQELDPRQMKGEVVFRLLMKVDFIRKSSSWYRRMVSI